MTRKRRPWYRPRNIALVLLAAVAVFLAWALVETVKVYRAQPNPTVDSREKLRALVTTRAGVTRAEVEESWELLEGILDDLDDVHAEVDDLIVEGAFGPVDENTFGLDYSNLVYGDPSDVDRAAVRRALELLRGRGVFDRVAELAAGPPALRPITGQGALMIDGTLDDLSRARQLAQALGAAMRVAADNADFDEAARAFDWNLALARSIAWQPYLISYLTALAIEALATGYLGDALMEHDFDEAACVMLLESFERHLGFPDVVFPLEAERIFFHDWIQWMYSDDGAGDGYLVAGLMLDPSLPPVREQSILGAAAARFFMATRAELVARYDDVMDRLIAATRLRSAERVITLNGIEAYVDGLSNRYILISNALVSFTQNRFARDVKTEGVRVMVALEAYDARHGRYPESLDALVPDVLPQPPVDPLHGLPFGYAVLTDDFHGRPYLLYSVGLDETDNLGREPPPSVRGEHGWAVALRNPDVRLIDFVINAPREE